MANKFGWKRPALPLQTPYKFHPALSALLPYFVDISKDMPPVYNQEDLGSCTANAGAALAEFTMTKIGKKRFKPSRLAIYYWTRLAEDGHVENDDGASLAQTMNTLDFMGVPHESSWWYNTKKFAVKPSKKIQIDANNHIMAKGLSLSPDLFHLRSCLAEGWPFMFGFTVYSSFSSIKKNGFMPMPKQNEEIIGGHAVVACGYNDNSQVFKIRNSWGSDWGDKGYFYMPYDFIASRNFADDFWTSKDFSTWS